MLSSGLHHFLGWVQVLEPLLISQVADLPDHDLRLQILVRPVLAAFSVILSFEETIIKLCLAIISEPMSW